MRAPEMSRWLCCKSAGEAAGKLQRQAQGRLWGSFSIRRKWGGHLKGASARHKAAVIQRVLHGAQAVPDRILQQARHALSARRSVMIAAPDCRPGARQPSPSAFCTAHKPSLTASCSRRGMLSAPRAA